MVYTVTFNPAIDLVVSLNELAKGRINRCESEEMICGGKGINVSIVLSHLGIQSKALGFVAGFTGSAIEQWVEAEGVQSDFVRLKEGNTRINMKVKAAEETEINGQGPHIPEEAVEELFSKLDGLKEDATLVFNQAQQSRVRRNVWSSSFLGGGNYRIRQKAKGYGCGKRACLHGGRRRHSCRRIRQGSQMRSVQGQGGKFRRRRGFHGGRLYCRQ